MLNSIKLILTDLQTVTSRLLEHYCPLVVRDNCDSYLLPCFYVIQHFHY